MAKLNGLCKRYTIIWHYLKIAFEAKRASLIAQLVKNLPAVQFLVQEDLLEKGLATHSSILGLPLWFSW